MPPQGLCKVPDHTVNATQLGLSCISQSLGLDLSASIPFFSGAPEGEDCLNLNIWTKPGRKNAPVLVWIYGGAWLLGSANIPLYDGTIFAANNDVVIVSMNYRTNVFGFPNSPGAKTENLGILDQRLALEWVRDNIEYFGGDPHKVVIFGQSAGGGSVDIHSYAWPKNPIVKGYITQSGNVELVDLISGGDNYDRWGNLTEAVGCSKKVTEKEKFICMQELPLEKIQAGMKVLVKSCLGITSNFGPRADGKVVFSPAEYHRRAKLGQFAKLPLLVGSTDKEIVPNGILDNPDCPPAPQSITPQQIAQIGSDVTFTCPALHAARYRTLNKVPAWLYRWFGSFDYNSTFNINPLGPTHAFELPVIFGTALYIGNPPQRERALIKYLQSVWVAFAANPATGLSNPPWNFPHYDPSNKKPTMLRLAYGHEVVPSRATTTQYLEFCNQIEHPYTDSRLKRETGNDVGLEYVVNKHNLKRSDIDLIPFTRGRWLYGLNCGKG